MRNTNHSFSACNPSGIQVICEILEHTRNSPICKIITKDNQDSATSDYAAHDMNNRAGLRMLRF